MQIRYLFLPTRLLYVEKDGIDGREELMAPFVWGDSGENKVVAWE